MTTLTNNDVNEYQKIINCKAWILYDSYKWIYEFEDLQILGWIALQRLKSTYIKVGMKVPFKAYVHSYLTRRIVDIIREELRSKNKYFKIISTGKKCLDYTVPSYDSMILLYEEKYEVIKKQVLDSLPHYQKQYFIDYYQNGKTQKEIGRQFNRTHSSISQIIHKINKEIDKRMKKEMEALGWLI